jgi:hypothetical protein
MDKDERFDPRSAEGIVSNISGFWRRTTSKAYRSSSCYGSPSGGRRKVMTVTRYKYPVVHRDEDTLGYNYTNSVQDQGVMIQLAKELAVKYGKFDLLLEIAVYYEGHDIDENQQESDLLENINLK